MTRVSGVRRTSLLAAAIAALACDGGEMARPAAMVPAAANRTQFSNNQNPTPKLLLCSGRRVVVASGRFGPPGGTLAFGNSRLIIPGGALHETVTITASTPSPSSSEVIFKPEGLRFFKPAGLVLDATGCQTPEDAAPSVVYLSPSGAILETIPADYDSHWKAVAAPISHFSGYAIAF
ncbi:hypothetical protein BH11GEM1_BH11GEM1_02260 [soil metagenome]